MIIKFALNYEEFASLNAVLEGDWNRYYVSQEQAGQRTFYFAFVKRAESSGCLRPTPTYDVTLEVCETWEMQTGKNTDYPLTPSSVLRRIFDAVGLFPEDVATPTESTSPQKVEGSEGQDLLAQLPCADCGSPLVKEDYYYRCLNCRSTLGQS